MRILACFMPASGGTAQGRGVRRVSPVDGGATPHRLPAGKRPALLRHAGRAVPRLRGGGEGGRASGATAAGGRRHGPLHGRGRPESSDREAVQGLSAARGARPGDRERSGGAHPGRADDRARPQADHRDPVAHQIARRQAHRDPVDAHPPGGLDGVRRGGHHQQGRHRRAGPDRHPGRAVLPDLTARGRDRRSAVGGRRPDPRDSRRPVRAGSGARERRRTVHGRGGARPRRARRDLPDGRPAAVGSARAQAGGNDARGGLHPGRRGRGSRRGIPGADP